MLLKKEVKEVMTPNIKKYNLEYGGSVASNSSSPDVGEPRPKRSLSPHEFYNKRDLIHLYDDVEKAAQASKERDAGWRKKVKDLEEQIRDMEERINREVEAERLSKNSSTNASYRWNLRYNFCRSCFIHWSTFTHRKTMGRRWSLYLENRIFIRKVEQRVWDAWRFIATAASTRTWLLQQCGPLTRHVPLLAPSRCSIIVSIREILRLWYALICPFSQRDSNTNFVVTNPMGTEAHSTVLLVQESLRNGDEHYANSNPYQHWVQWKKQIIRWINTKTYHSSIHPDRFLRRKDVICNHNALFIVDTQLILICWVLWQFAVMQKKVQHTNSERSNDAASARRQIENANKHRLLSLYYSHCKTLLRRIIGIWSLLLIKKKTWGQTDNVCDHYTRLAHQRYERKLIYHIFHHFVYLTQQCRHVRFHVHKHVERMEIQMNESRLYWAFQAFVLAVQADTSVRNVISQGEELKKNATRDIINNKSIQHYRTIIHNFFYAWKSYYITEQHHQYTLSSLKSYIKRQNNGSSVQDYLPICGWIFEQWRSIIQRQKKIYQSLQKILLWSHFSLNEIFDNWKIWHHTVQHHRFRIEKIENNIRRRSSNIKQSSVLVHCLCS